MPLRLTILLCLFSLNLFAQQPANYKWGKKLRPSPTIPSQFVDADAVILFKEVNRTCTRERDRNFFSEHIRQRIKIQQAAGLECTRMKIPVKPGFRIQTLDARTLKIDGSIIDFDARQARQLVLRDENDLLRKEVFYLMAIPGAEVGDEIETVVTYRSEIPDMADTYFFHDDFPVVESRLSLKLSKSINIRLKSYHGLPDPIITPEVASKKYFWQQDSLIGFQSENCASIPADTLAHLAYELHFDEQSNIFLTPSRNNWLDYLFWIYKEDLKTTIRRPNKFQQLLRQIQGDKRRTIKGMAGVFHEFVNTKITVKSIAQNEQSRGLEYFLEKEKADNFTLLRLYKAFLENYDIPYYFVVGKDRFKGAFDLEFPSSAQATHLFFAIGKDEDISFLVPRTRDLSYRFGELPVELEGTTLYMIDPKNKKILYELEIPLSDYTSNQRTQTTLLKPNFETKKILCEATAKYSGACATTERDFFQQARKKDGVFQTFNMHFQETCPNAKLSGISTEAQDEEQADLFKVKYDYELDKAITSGSNDTWHFSFQHRFRHDLHEVKATDCSLGYHPTYTSIDAFSDYLSFPQPVELLNMDNVQYQLSNEVGVYELSVVQVKPKLIRIRSRYVISAPYISQEDLPKLAQLNEMARQSVLRGLEFRVLE